jgi:hypothetical protein
VVYEKYSITQDKKVWANDDDQDSTFDYCKLVLTRKCHRSSYL